MKLTIIKFEYGELVTALYIDGILHSYGDEYHTKITDWIEGFKAALEMVNHDFIYETIDVDSTHPICERIGDGDCPYNDLGELLSEIHYNK